MHFIGEYCIIYYNTRFKKCKVCYSVFVTCTKAIDKPLRFSGFDAHVHEFVIQVLQESESARSFSLPAYFLALSLAELTVTETVCFDPMHLYLM